MVKICPSIASGNLLQVAQELDYIDKYFNELHIDIEDGHAVNTISFGFKMAEMICDYSKSKKTMHLEIDNPLKFMDKVKALDLDVVFIEVDCLNNPCEVIKKYQENKIHVGINLSHLDMDRKDLNSIINLSDYILVNTTHHDDINQICDIDMVKYAIQLSEIGKKVWIDGGINYEIYEQVKNTKIYAAVMGRAIFENRELAIQRYTI